MIDEPIRSKPFLKPNYHPDDIPYIRSAVNVWLATFERETGANPTPADASHSALLWRLLEGKDPLPKPPPKAFAYPWYDVIEKEEVEVTEFNPTWPLKAWDTVTIEQSNDWIVVEASERDEILVVTHKRYVGKGSDDTIFWQMTKAPRDGIDAWKMKKLTNYVPPKKRA